MSRKLHPLAPYATFRADDWTTICDLTAARWLRAGYHPDQLDPATGVPLEGAVLRVDPDADPSVAEAVLRASDEVLERVRRRSLTVRAVMLAAAMVAGVLGMWIGGAL